MLNEAALEPLHNTATVQSAGPYLLLPGDVPLLEDLRSVALREAQTGKG